MELTGTLVYDPVARATGKDRARIIRRHAQNLHVLTRAYTPYLQGKLRRTANIYDQLVADDSHFWIRDQSPAGPKHLARFYDFAKRLSETAVSEVPAMFSDLLTAQIARVEYDLILTRMNPNWAILQMDFESVRPWLEELRGQGLRISCSVWKPHVSVIRGEPRRNRWYVDEGKSFTIEVANKISKNRRGYYWLAAKCVALEQVRTSMGLAPRPSPPFHLTIGKAQ